MTNLSAPALITDQAEAVLQVFQAAEHPLTAPQAEKLYQGPKLKKKQLAQIVESELLMQGKLFKCSPSGKTPRYWTQDEAEKVRDKVEELLTGQDLDEKKLTAAVNKALPKISSPAAIKGHIQTMHREGLVHERPGKGDTKILSLQPYSVQYEEEKVRAKVVELLTGQDLDEKKLAAAVDKALPNISSPTAIKGHIQTMHREGLVHERPGKGKAKTKLLSLQAPSPFDAIVFTPATLKNLSKALTEVKSLSGGVGDFLQLICHQLRCTMPNKTLASEPEASERVYGDEHIVQDEGHSIVVGKVEPPPQAEIDELILKGMHDLDSAVDQGASVLLGDLRRHMPTVYRGHDTFDAAVFRLAYEDRIVLHRNDHPALLSEAERDELICEEGTYYGSIAKRV